MNVTRTRAARFVGLGLVAALSAATLAACSSPGTSGGPTTVTFSYLWSGDEATAIQKIIKTYNASQSDVVVKGVSSPDFQKQVTSMSSSKGSFDISDNFGNGVGAWASKGILEPLDSYMSKDGIKAGDFVAAAMDQMRYKGMTYSLPIAVHSFQLVYNKKLLAAAGVAVPKTMDELAAAAAKLTIADSSGAISQLGLGDPSVSTTITTLGYDFGGNWDKGGSASPTDSGNVEAATWYQDNITNKFGADKISTFVSGLGQYMSAQDPFYTGKYAMVIDGEWQALNIPKVAPGLEWGVTSIPYATSDLKNVTQLTASTLFIPANSQHKDAAAKFLAYLVSDKGMTAFSLALGNLPSRTDLLNSSAYDKIVGFSSWLDALKSKNVFALSSAPYASQYSTDLGKALGDLTRDAATPKAALQSVADKATSYPTK
jgi:multiple sugar transport system substrate-binding protein